MKAVGESMEYPLMYYKNNLVGMLNLLEVISHKGVKAERLVVTFFSLKVMEKFSCFQLVFSSSCTVYGEPSELPITERHQIGQNITNVYGKTKYFIEEMLKDITHANRVRQLSNYERG